MSVPTDPMLAARWRVRRIQKETHDTFTLELAPGDGEGGAFEAGQFNMLYVFGVGEVPLSISGERTAPRAIVHTVREVGAVTRAMRRLKRGDGLGVRGPFGRPWPVERAAGMDVVLVAGGIGLAPLRPVLSALVRRRAGFGRVVLLYGTRSPEDILYRRELEGWHSAHDVEVRVTVDRAIGAWPGNVGVVTALIPRAPFDPVRSVAMICGPEVMMRFAAEGLLARGVRLENIYLSMERNMKCAIGFCGHCQFGPMFVCKDGPVFEYGRVRRLLESREI